MFKKLTLAFFLLFISFIATYPSRKEITNFLDYCYALEKILSTNALEKSIKISKELKPFLKDTSSFGTNKSKGILVNKIINQYKTSKKLSIVTFVPNKFICLTGYWVEVLKPGTFQAIFYEKSKQKINQYHDIKEEADQFIKEINSEYKSLKKEIKDLF